MKFKHVYIEKMAYELPDEEWSSALIENKLKPLYERLHLPEGRIELMTGILSRRFWSQSVKASDASTFAGKKLLGDMNINKESIDILIHCSVCRDRLEPATAAYVHRNLGLSGKTQILDISNACLGFLNALSLAGGLIESGQVKRVLVVAGENGKPLVENTIQQLLNRDWNRKEIKPFFANFTIGSGCVAAMLSHESVVNSAHSIKVESLVNYTDSNYNHLCEGDTTVGDALAMQTDSEELLVAGIQTAQRAWDLFMEEAEWSRDTADHIICHQVGKTHRNKLYEGLQLDLRKDHSTFPFLGNVGSVSVPITLAHAWSENKLKSGDKLALLGIGSGLSSIMASASYI